ncbi:MAG TPA: DoxX family protein [Thermoanaerobaculia bacterium]|jgi:uncharacterized membrane protein YphA (DoxX/SURF4 family)
MVWNSRSRLQQVAVIGVRVLLGAIFFTSGMGKLTHGDFVGLIGPVWLEERLAQYGLGLWAQFVAWSQVTIGLLLLSQRFATLGAVMLVPMLVNILVVTISLQWRGTPYVNAVLLLLNLFLLATDWRKLLPLVAESDGAVVHRREPRQVSKLVVLGLIAGISSPAVYGLHRMATFVLAALAVSLFAAATVKEYRRIPARPDARPV